MATGNVGSGCHVCLISTNVWDPDAGKGIHCRGRLGFCSCLRGNSLPTPLKVREPLGKAGCVQVWLQRGWKRRSCLTGLASMRNCAACQVAIGIVWFTSVPLHSLREDTFKVSVPLREPSLQSLCLVELKGTRNKPDPFKPVCSTARREINAHCPRVCLGTHTAEGLFFQKEI